MKDRYDENGADKPSELTKRPHITASAEVAGEAVAITLKFTEQELAAVQELADYHQLSQLQTMRQALRLYQLHDRRIRDGETLAWSGDAARAQEFAALASPPCSEGVRGSEVRKEELREVIRRALIDAKCTSRDTTVVNDGMTNVLNVVLAAIASIVAQAVREPHERTYLRGWNEAVEHCAE